MRKVVKKKKLPKAVIGTKSTAKVTGGRSSRRKNSVNVSSSKLAKVADKTRTSSATASAGTFQPAKMSPVKKTTKAVNVRKASSFDKAKKKAGKSLAPKRKKKRGR